MLAIFLDRGQVPVLREHEVGVAIRGGAMTARRTVIVRSLSTMGTELATPLGVMLRGGRPRVSRRRETRRETRRGTKCGTRFRRRSERAGVAMVTAADGTARPWIRSAITTLILWMTMATRSMATILTPMHLAGSVRAAGISPVGINLAAINRVGASEAAGTTGRSVSNHPAGFRLPARAQAPVWGRVVARKADVARLVDRHSVRWVVRQWAVAGSRGVMPRRVAARILVRLRGAAVCVGPTWDVAVGTATKGRSIAPRIPT